MFSFNRLKARSPFDIQGFSKSRLFLEARFMGACLSTINLSVSIVPAVISTSTFN